MSLERISTINEDSQKEVKEIDHSKLNWVVAPEAIESIEESTEIESERNAITTPAKMGLEELLPKIETKKSFAEAINEVERFAEDPRLEDIHTQLQLITAAAKKEYMSKFPLRLKVTIDEEKRKKELEDFKNSPVYARAQALAAERKAKREAEARKRGINIEKAQTHEPNVRKESIIDVTNFEEINDEIPTEIEEALKNTTRVWTANATVDSRFMLGLKLFEQKIPESIQIVQEAARRYLTREDTKDDIQEEEENKPQEPNKKEQITFKIDEEKKKKDLEEIQSTDFYKELRQNALRLRKEREEREKANT